MAPSHVNRLSHFFWPLSCCRRWRRERERKEEEEQKEINFFAPPPFFPLLPSSERVRAEAEAANRAGEYYAAEPSQFTFCFPSPLIH